MKRFVTLLTALALCAGLSTSALAVAPWALDGLVEAEALEMLIAEDMELLEQAVSPEKLAVIAQAAAAKLALLDPAAQAADAGEDLTRGGVLNALYACARTFDAEGAGAVSFLSGLGVVQGDENGDYHLERPCTLQEAFLFAQRLVLALYDRADAGTRGLLWKVENEGNTLYLYGTYHVDQGNLYPFHQEVRKALKSSQTLCLEVDFGDQEGIQEFMEIYYYPEGEGLEDHITPESYAAAVEALAPYGYDESSVSSMKAWAVGNALESLASTDETSGTVMVTDSYLHSKAICNGLTVDQVESYGYQGRMLDGLSPETQQAMVDDGLKMLAGELEGEEELDLFTPWQSGDAQGFARGYGKDEPTEDPSELEMIEALFGLRDPGMADWCRAFLTREGTNTATFAVGAGHMVGQTGVVELLRQAGYTVAPVFEGAE